MPPTPPDGRNAFYRAFNSVYGRLENAYSQLIGRMITQSALMCAIALVVIGMAIYGLVRVPTGFLPIEDQGYVIVSAQLPDGASLDRTKGVLDRVTEIARKTPGVDQVIAISGVSALDNNSPLANAGVAYVVLKDWSKRGKGEDLRSLFENLNRELGIVKDARLIALPPPPIQGIGNAANFAMQLELRDGSGDLTKLESITNASVRLAQTQSALQRVASNFRTTVPQMKVDVDRAKAHPRP